DSLEHLLIQRHARGFSLSPLYFRLIEQRLELLNRRDEPRHVAGASGASHEISLHPCCRAGRRFRVHVERPLFVAAEQIERIAPLHRIGVKFRHPPAVFTDVLLQPFFKRFLSSHDYSVSSSSYQSSSSYSKRSLL